MWEYIIPAIATVIVSIIEFFANRDRKRAQIDREAAETDRKKAEEDRRRFEEEREESKKQRQLRAKESMLAVKMSNACLQLCIVSANALTGGHNNGNVERAKAAAEDAQKEYSEFIGCVAAERITK